MPPTAIEDLIPHAPRWTRRSLFLALTATAAVYLGLPLLERSPQPGKALRPVHSVDTFAPAPLPRRIDPARDVVARDPAAPRPHPIPRLADTARPRPVLQTVLDGIPLWEGIGADFGVRAEDLARQVHDLIFDARELDNPPRPLARLQPLYPPQARMQNLEGYVTVEFVVDEDGAVRDIEVLSSHPGDLFVRPVQQALRRWRFRPAVKDGSPVSARIRQTITFSLESP